MLRLPDRLGRLPLIAATVALAIAVFAIVLHTLTSDTDLTDRQAVALALAQGVALVLALRMPRPAWTISIIAVALASIRVDSGLWVDAMFNSYLVVLGVIALRVGPRSAALMWAGTLLAGVVIVLIVRPADSVAGLVEAAALGGLVLVAGSALRGLAAARDHLHREREQAEHERERNAVLEERARIARELHDVVAHHMSVIAIQAEAAPYRDPDLTPQTAATLTAIRAGATTALGETRRILGVLRSGDTGVAPQPSLVDVDRLVESLQATGVSVTTETTGDLSALPAGLGLSAYRIVQEALSNAVRHAPGCPIRVRIDRTDGQITIRVRNELTDGTEIGSGHGLLGMRERVTMLGGTLEAGPVGDREYVVAVTLPVEDERR
ncbi:sensor histidine kinase [Nocardia cyriacigeorgica]|uniref:sensor histidine kinase n=1 Tax=Nocardia cyriacigeorgica TaxID=135487 RepID=UPI0018953E23|nr:histidine kinase [Nocardia cyriacigeorgica]MBF6416175.1 two-component sensor histidine kinase [Nocardia cyriacigeorgica]